MAFGKVKESGEAGSYKRYIGICPVSVIAINPDKTTQEALFNTALESEPVYLTEKEVNGEFIKQAIISVILKPDTEKIGFDMPYISMRFFLQNNYRYNGNKDKVQVIDKYGRTCWVSVEDAKIHNVPVGKNGKPYNIDKDYRPALIGEEDLMSFIKTYLCIDDIMTWDSVTSSFIPNPKVNPEDCECRFDNLKKIFDGDFKEVIETLSLLPNNKVKVLLGVRTNPETGNIYQTVMTRVFIKNSSTNYKPFIREVESQLVYAATNNRPVSTQYDVSPVHEFVVTPTPVTPTPVESTNDFIEDDDDKLPWDL